MNSSLRALLISFLLLLPFAVHANVPDLSPLDTGFQRLYNLDFTSAQHDFSVFEQARPQDPLGPAAEAAACVFSELNRLGVLESRFFTNDSAFRSRTSLKPDPVMYQRFTAALARTEELANSRLATAPRDHDALLAKTLAAGLQADYASLIEDRNLAALKYSRQATASAQELLAVCPDCYDAYVATGISQYLIGALSAPLRWMVRLGGYSGNKAEGIQQLRLAAERGHYLAPFARILLAVAYVREKKPAEARAILEHLRSEFPGNPLFPRELARLEKP